MASNRKTQTESFPDDGLERIHVRIPSDLATALRVRCAEGRKSLAEGVAEAIRVWIKFEKPLE